MIYVKRENGKVVAFSFEYVSEFENRNDWKSFEEVTEVAEGLSELTGDAYLPTDSGPYCSPRYDVIKAPKIGDKISYAFNGDYYPCGEIVSISPTYKKIVGSNGHTFYRRKLTGSWLRNRMWSMVNGHIKRWNPEF